MIPLESWRRFPERRRHGRKKLCRSNSKELMVPVLDSLSVCACVQCLHDDDQERGTNKSTCIDTESLIDRLPPVQ